MNKLSSIADFTDKGSSSEPQVSAAGLEPDFLKEREINVDEIIVTKGRRKVDPNWVRLLAEDFKRRGQQTAIKVVSQKNGYRLVFGLHRLEAARFALQGTVRAIVASPKEYANEAEIKLSEIAENMLRRELSVLDRSMDVAAWREIYEVSRGAVKPGRKIGGTCATNANEPPSAALDDGMLQEFSSRFAATFTEAAQLALGMSRDAIFRSLKIASIDETVRDKIALHPPLASNLRELLALARQPQARQGEIANRILNNEAENVSDAITQIDKIPAATKPTKWQVMASSFAKLPDREQEQFFELNSAAIERWQARKG